MPNTEDIEAKLCGYVDGDLDAAGRADIERHLATNPQHRTLMDELTRQREMLRALPRERAPVDVAETLNAQLERSALLNEDDWRDRPIRISHWPQIKAAAAVLMLVSGLAAVVYYVIPSPNRPNPEIALNLPSAEGLPRGVDAEPRTEVSSTTTPTGIVMTGAGTPDLAHVTGPAEISRPGMALSDAVPEGARDVMTNAVPMREDIFDAAFGPSRARGGARVDDGGWSAKAVRIEVVAADAVAAEQQVREYLENNSIRFTDHATDAAMPVPLELDPSQTVMGSRLQQTRVKMREAPVEAPVENTIETEKKEHVAVIPDLSTNDETRAANVSNDLRAGAVGGASPNPLPGVSGTVTGTSTQSPAPDDEQRQLAAGMEAQQKDKLAVPQQPQNPAPSSTRYFAHGLKRSEVDQLRRRMSEPAGQTAQIVGEDVAAAQRSLGSTSDLGRGNELGDWSLRALFPWMAQSQARESSHAKQYALLPPTTQSSDEDRVNVLIVVRQDEAPRSPQEDPQTTTEAPATSPATSPSSP